MSFHDPATTYAEALENLTEENMHTERALIETEIEQRLREWRGGDDAKIVSATEWAVLQGDSRTLSVLKGPFPTRAEAEAWRVAMEITRNRSNNEHFLATDGIVSESPLFIGSREVTPWGADA
jgi:hypothetical protein